VNCGEFAGEKHFANKKTTTLKGEKSPGNFAGGKIK